MENRDRSFKCFRGCTPDTCPKHDLEVTRLVYGVLLLCAVVMLVACNLIWHG